MKSIDKDYKLIPMSEITDEARMIAVRWVEGYRDAGGIEIQQKHKLASDIMNYALNHLKSQVRVVVIGNHTEGCWAEKLVKDKDPLAVHSWNVLKARLVMMCDENGVEMTEEQVMATGKAEAFYELPCGNDECGCVKRINAKDLGKLIFQK